MRYFFAIVCFISFQIGFSQSYSPDFLFDVDLENYRNFIQDYNRHNPPVQNARTAEMSSNTQLDSVITYTYTSPNDSSLYRLKVHFPDDYGNDTLIITSQWNEANQVWEPYDKVEHAIDPLTKWSYKNLSYRWNSELETWLPAWHLWRFQNEYGQLDSLASFSNDDLGNINYAYKTKYETMDEGKHRIGTEINLDIETGIWHFYRRIEIYLNEEGNIDLEITEYWNKETNEFEYYRKLIYDWDSLGFSLVMLEKRWDNGSQSWLDNRVDNRMFTDDNGSTEHITLIWDQSQSLWAKSRRVITTFNDIGRMIELKGDSWNNVDNDWVPLFHATWEFDNETGYRKQMIDRQIWDENTNDWMIINSESYEYKMERKYSQVSKYDWDFNSSLFILNERDFFIYKEKEIIVDVPSKIEDIIGPDTLCVNSEEVIFKAYRKPDIKSFTWNIIPVEAGDFSESDSLIVLTLKEDYVGPLGFTVAGENGFGKGEYSDTLDVFILDLPDKPLIPEGPTELNQFSGTVNYSLDQSEFAVNYIWMLNVGEAGILESEKNIASFDLSEKYEGNFNIKVQLENRCGLSSESDPLNIDAFFITDVSLVNKSNRIKIYPNPAKDYINIELNENAELKYLRILDLNGKEVMKKTLIRTRHSNLHSIAIEPGIYTILIETAHNMISQKLIIK